MNIKKHILNYKIRDYIEDELNILKDEYIDCTVGINSFIDVKIYDEILSQVSVSNDYGDIVNTDLKYSLKNKFRDVIKLDLENISFGSGSIGCIRGIFDIILEPGDKVLGICPWLPKNYIRS